MSQPETLKGLSNVTPELYQDIRTILSVQGSIVIIKGKPGYGKTDIALLIGEVAHNEKMLVGTNTAISNQEERFDKITNLTHLSSWLFKLNRNRRKLFIFDDIDTHLPSTRATSTVNVEFTRKVITQLRKGGAILIGILKDPSWADKKLLNSFYSHTIIKKIAREIAVLNSTLLPYPHSFGYEPIPRTSILFDSKGYSEFELHPTELPKWIMKEKLEPVYNWAVLGQTIADQGMHYEAFNRIVKKFVASMLQNYQKPSALSTSTNERVPIPVSTVEKEA